MRYLLKCKDLFISVTESIKSLIRRTIAIIKHDRKSRILMLIGTMVFSISILLVVWFSIINPAIISKKEALLISEGRISSEAGLNAEKNQHILTSVISHDASGAVVPSADSFSIEYNSDGKLISESGYKVADNFYNTSNYILLFDEIGRPESITLFYIGIDGFPKHYRRSDAHGRITADVYYTNDKEVDSNNSFFYSYYGSSQDSLVSGFTDDFPVAVGVSDLVNGNGLCRVDSYYIGKSSGSDLVPYKNNYDELGNVVNNELEATTDPGIISSNQSYVSDASGNTISRIEEFRDNSFRYVNEYDINNYNLLRRETFYSEDYRVSSYEYSYDKQNRLVRKGFIIASASQNMFDMDSEYHSGYYSYAYDKFGNLVQQRLYRTDGSAVVYWNYSWDRTYDNNNNLVKQVNYVFDNSSKITRIWEFDKNSVLLSISQFGSDRWKDENWRTDYEYDDSGYIKSITNAYDSHENPAKFIIQDRTEYSIKPDGNMLVEKGIYDEFGALIQIETQEFDHSGKLLLYKSESSSYSAQTTFRYQNIYDYNGRLLKEIVFQNDILSSYTQYSYNKNGDMYKRATYNGEDELLNYTDYVYSDIPVN